MKALLVFLSIKRPMLYSTIPATYVGNIVFYYTAWPDLPNFCHFGKILRDSLASSEDLTNFDEKMFLGKFLLL